MLQFPIGDISEQADSVDSRETSAWQHTKHRFFDPRKFAAYSAIYGAHHFPADTGFGEEPAAPP